MALESKSDDESAFYGETIDMDEEIAWTLENGEKQIYEGPIDFGSSQSSNISTDRMHTLVFSDGPAAIDAASIENSSWMEAESAVHHAASEHEQNAVDLFSAATMLIQEGPRVEHMADGVDGDGVESERGDDGASQESEVPVEHPAYGLSADARLARAVNMHNKEGGSLRNCALFWNTTVKKLRM